MTDWPDLWNLVFYVMGAISEYMYLRISGRVK